METKKSKVTEKKVAFTKEEIDPETGIPTQVPQKDNNGNITFNVSFENGDKGLWKVQKKFDYFQEGKESEYVIEKKISTKGNEYFAISIPKQDKPAYGGGSKYQPKKKDAYRADMIGYGFSYAKDMQVNDKLLVVEDKEGGVTVGKFVGIATAITKAMWKLLDEIEGLE